ncbi:MAG: DNA polymerase III subunit delta [Hyphomicrobiaceae bacterium]
MVAIKAAQSEKFVDAPPTGCLATLVFGSDVGLVSERAAKLARTFAARSDPDGEIIRIEDPDLEQDPDRLIVELQTMPMFGGAKVVRTSLGRRVTAALVKSVIDGGQPAAQLIVEAGNLKPTDAARKAFEATPWAAAIPCYSDDDRDLTSLVRDMLATNGKSVERDALEALVARLGADRALSRGEVDKLILYVGERGSIKAEDVRDIVGDASDMALEQIAEAAADGHAAHAVRDFDRSVAAGENPQALIAGVQRYFRRLHRLRSAIDQGQSFDAAARALRPPLFFKQKDKMAAQCRSWTHDRLLTAMRRISEVARDARLNASLDATYAERLLLELATMARQQQRR